MTPKTKEEAARQAYDKGRTYTPQHHSWSNGTVLALQDVFNMRDDNVFKAASGLHGGIGGRGDVCGSLLGASLMLGLMCGDGPEVIHEFGERDVATELVGDIYKWFKKEFGSAKCRRIRTRFQREIDDEVNGRELSERERMDRQHAKCDVLAGKTSARTAEMIWDVMEAKKK